jgi:aminoglycoside phosphotransferase (APT) family kinase protein
VVDGRLAAVIDFGTSGIGDPACDTVIAWTLLTGTARDAYRDGLGLDEQTWDRGRGWALWKALITIAEHREQNPPIADEARRVLFEVLD